MEKLLPQRYIAFALCLSVFALSLALSWNGEFYRWLAVISGALSFVGIVDIAQKKKTLRRNFPVTAHIRTFFE